MSVRWQLTVYLIVLWINVYVDGRFRRLASGLYGSSSLPSGGWRLMKSNELFKDYSGSSGHHGGPSSSLSSQLSSPLSSLFNNQRVPTINPVIHSNHWRLPFGYNNLDRTDSTEYYLDANNQGDNLDQQSRLNGNHRHRPLIVTDKVNSKDHETLEKVSQITTPSSVASSIVPRPQSSTGEVRANLGSPESLLGEEVSSRSASKVSSLTPSTYQVHYAYKKAESESTHAVDPYIQYRSFNHGNKHSGSSAFGDLYFVAIVVGSSGIAIFAVIGAGYCFYRFQQHNKSAADVDYPAYGVVGPITKETTNSGNISPIGDRKLAQSAQMYHYHHQKQQMIASEKVAASRHTSASDVDSEEENEEGDYTVYECPGLASTGEMEVKNPLFQDDITPVSSPSIVTNGGDSKEKK